jgi:hypothetical protein
VFIPRQAEIDDKNIIVYLNNDSLDSSKVSESVKQILTQWYKNRAKYIFEERIKIYSERLGLKFSKLSLCNASRRWGSCTSKNAIRINWHLVMASINIIDYVVVHELCHLKHHNHKKQFWQLVESIVPDYKNCRKQLRKEGIIYSL